VRGGRLVSVLLILQQRGRVTSAELARELEVSQRTILRDLDELSGAGVPVYATRGPGGGFELLEGFRADLQPLVAATESARGTARTPRARVRITPEGRRLAAVMSVLQPLRIRRSGPPDDEGRLEATFRIHTFESAIFEILALGPHVEVLEPPSLRIRIAELTAATARRYHTRTRRGRG
jgi:predicted DNA-binding transcriptional regulator YafY